MQAILTCPYCQKKQQAIIPQNACQYFYRCRFCQQMIKPQTGDCCVFCSYADLKCPFNQSNKSEILFPRLANYQNLHNWRNYVD